MQPAVPHVMPDTHAGIQMHSLLGVPLASIQSIQALPRALSALPVPCAHRRCFPPPPAHLGPSLSLGQQNVHPALQVTNARPQATIPSAAPKDLTHWVPHQTALFVQQAASVPRLKIIPSNVSQALTHSLVQQHAQPVLLACPVRTPITTHRFRALLVLIRSDPKPTAQFVLQAGSVPTLQAQPMLSAPTATILWRALQHALCVLLGMHALAKVPTRCSHASEEPTALVGNRHAMCVLQDSHAHTRTKLSRMHAMLDIGLLAAKLTVLHVQPATSALPTLITVHLRASLAGIHWVPKKAAHVALMVTNALRRAPQGHCVRMASTPSQAQLNVACAQKVTTAPHPQAIQPSVTSEPILKPMPPHVLHALRATRVLLEDLSHQLVPRSDARPAQRTAQ